VPHRARARRLRRRATAGIVRAQRRMSVCDGRSPTGSFDAGDARQCCFIRKAASLESGFLRTRALHRLAPTVPIAHRSTNRPVPRSQENFVKSLVVTAAAMMLAAPALSCAQATQPPVTRAQVLQELYDLESVGYNPARGEVGNYPDDILAAQHRLTAKRVAQRKAAQAAYGSSGEPATESGVASSRAR
jgi:hypothetical protein